MAKKVKNPDKKMGGIGRDTKDGIAAVFLFLVSIIFILSALNKAGPVGVFIFDLSTKLLGIGYYLFPLACLLLGISFLRNTAGRHFPITKIIGSLVFFFSGLGLTDIFFQKGGTVGSFIAESFLKLFDFYASIFILGALVVAAILIILETKLTVSPLLSLWDHFTQKIKREKTNTIKKPDEVEDVKIENEHDEDEYVEDEEIKTKDEDRKKESRATSKKISSEELENEADTPFAGFKSFGRLYTPPPLSLLERDSGKPIAGDIKANANIIKRTLQNFGISVEMDEVSIGPSVSRYAIKPAEGVKLSKIAALQDNLAYALAAHPIRIEAPIPGKSLVGIEVPNSAKSMVGLASMLSSDEYQQSEKPLLISLGKTISGKSQFGNLGKMPHLLIAGSTGSGKSVTIHTIVNSLIFRNSPDNLKFIMIDPKRVELTLYNKIPHLLTPVITEAKKAILALKWAAKEMDRRYEILESNSVRDVDSYHKNILTPALKKSAEKEGDTTEEKPLDLMPYIVIVIDELADIMTSYPRELEAAVVRLAQMSRAVGIHLILSTQRPSVNVITGLIKANIPGRIALQVSSQIDSRTILDTGGAEKLLGAGDMLYLGGDMSKPLRIQSAFISETEVKKVTKYLREAYIDELPSEIALTGDAVAENGPSIFGATFDGDEEDVDDDLYESAREEVIKVGKASTSYIQRKLRVGYARAARLMDMLEERGVIGPADGARPREVLDPIHQDNEVEPADKETQTEIIPEPEH